MFDAARAALRASKAPVPPEVAKTHSGLISAFSLHLVKAGLVSPQDYLLEREDARKKQSGDAG